MEKTVGILAGIVLLAGGAGVWSLLAQSSRPVSDKSMARTASHELRSDRRPKPGEASAEAGKPLVVVDERQHDFEIMDPGQTGQHTFLLRNGGNAPLEIEPGPTTCKCTMAELEQRVIPPGGEAEVNVKWTTLYQPGFFYQTASVLTNDALKPKIRFAVQGNIRFQIGVDPPSLAFPRVAPDRSATRTAMVYSQVWDFFAITRVESSMEGLTWQAEPVEADVVARFRGKSGYRLQVTLPPDLPPGHFSHWLRLHVDGTTDEDGVYEPPVYEVALRGKVLRRLSVYGQGIDGTGVVYIGPVPSGQGAELKLLMKVRDQQHDLAVKSVESTPEFLQARVTPRRAVKSGDMSLYELEIKVPSDAPSCFFMGAPPGQVKIHMAHPRIPTLTLPVKFAVTAHG